MVSAQEFLFDTILLSDYDAIIEDLSPVWRSFVTNTLAYIDDLTEEIIATETSAIERKLAESENPFKLALLVVGAGFAESYKNNLGKITARSTSGYESIREDAIASELDEGSKEKISALVDSALQYQTLVTTLLSMDFTKANYMLNRVSDNVVTAQCYTVLILLTLKSMMKENQHYQTAKLDKILTFGLSYATMLRDALPILIQQAETVRDSPNEPIIVDPRISARVISPTENVDNIHNDPFFNEQVRSFVYHSGLPQATLEKIKQTRNEIESFLNDQKVEHQITAGLYIDPDSRNWRAVELLVKVKKDLNFVYEALEDPILTISTRFLDSQMLSKILIKIEPF